jgi:Na+-transporting methylmalonyl-CoA/oxaloacetate decarboxylase gamma subunit
MTVVFIGLILCILFINVFNRFAKRVKWEGNEHGHAPPEPKAAAPAAVEPVHAPKKPKVEPPTTPEILAVIASALEIDQRLYQSSGVQRLTIRRAIPESR